MRTKRSNIFGLGLMLALAGAAWGYTFITNGGQPVKWNSGSIPFTIIADNSTTLFDGYTAAGSIQQAMLLWNARITAVQFAPTINPSATAGSGNHVNEVIFSANIFGQPFGDPSILAVTTTWVTGNGTVRSEADVVFNTAWTWDSYGGALATEIDIQRVALHELGHALGLNHPDQASPPQSVTAIMNAAVSNLDRLQQDDISGAQALYGGSGGVTAPANDAFANAASITLTSNSALATGTNLYATKEAGEPNHAGEVSGTSVWWKWTASSTGSMTVTTAGSNFDTLLGIYTGSTVSALSTIASNDDAASGGTRTSAVTFTATSGTTYYIAVDGWDYDSGSVALNLNFTPSVPSALQFTSRPLTRSLLVGDSYTFQASATGTGSLTYQWRRNGQVINGITGASFAISSAALADNGFYEVIVTDANSSAHSYFQLHVAPVHAGVVAWGSNDGGQATVPVGLGAVLAVSGGSHFTVALKTNGTLQAWGAPDHGGTALPAGLTKVVAVAAGNSHGLALKVDGSVVAWGDDSFGSPGAAARVPAGLSEVVAVAGGFGSSMALKADGTVVTWGFSQGVAKPASLAGVAAISAGAFHNLALKADGTVVGWGDNSNGAVTIPTGLSDVIAIDAGGSASGGHSLALKRDGTVVAWGYNVAGQCNVPAGLNNVVAIAAGGNFSLALKADGALVGWGANDTGQVTIPAQANGSIAVDAGFGQGLALTVVSPPAITTQPFGQTVNVGDTVNFSVQVSGVGPLDYHWSRNGVPLTDGGNVLGAATASLQISNVQVTDAGTYTVEIGNAGGTVTSNGATLVVAIPSSLTLRPASSMVTEGAAVSFTVAASSGGPFTYRWTHGRATISGATGATLNLAAVTYADRGFYEALVTNAAGGVSRTVFYLQVAIANPALTAWGDSVPTIPAISGSVAKIEIGSAFFVLKGDGSVVAWGNNSSGQATVPAGLNDLIDVSSGTFFTLGLRSDGTVVGWGDNVSGETNIPAGLQQVVAVAAGPNHGLALKSDGTLVGWGASQYGQHIIPAGLRDVVAIDTGRFRSLALKSDGTLVEWGYYQGAGSVNIPRPEVNIAAIAGGESHALGLKENGTVVAWGSDYAGSTVVPAGLSGVQAIAAAEDFGLALKSDGTVVGWGRDYEHQATPPAGLAGVIAVTAGGWTSMALTRTAAPSSSTQPTNQSASIGANANFIFVSAGTPVPTYQWQRLPAGSGTWSDLANGGAYSGVTTGTLTVASAALVMTGDQFRCIATNTAGSVTSTAATLTVTVPLPVITIQPVAATVAVGAPINLSVTATSPVALSYQWRKNGTDIGGATTSSYSIASAQLSDAADYTVVVSSSAGSVTSAGAAVVVAVPPVITTQPATQTVYAGATTSFSVTATSTAPLGYVWRKNGTPIGGATAATYPIVNAQAADAADYTVVVSNVAGSTTSSPATLTVNPSALPTFATQPVSQAIAAGMQAQFTVVATGAPAPTYQWQVLRAGTGTWSSTGDGASYSGSQTATLTIAGSLVANSGDQYRCVATNLAGSATSNAATLSVGAPGFGKISAGRYHSLRLNVVSQLYATGTNTAGQLGTGNTTTFTSPQPITLAGQTIVDMAAGGQHTLILTSAKELWATGFNGTGQLGDGTTAAKSTPIKIATNVVGMAAAVFHSAYLKADGTLWTFGGNDSGQLGNGTTTDSATPVQVATGVIDLALGNRQSFFLKSDGTAWGMGDMNGSGTPVSTPVQVASNVVALSAGAYHSLFLKADGTLWSMGFNAFGQLGNGTTADTNTPGQIASGVRAIAAGYFHSAFIKIDNSLWVTGYNSGGQLGDGTTTARSTPFQLAANVAAVSGSEAYTLFTKLDGTLWGTGYNAYGQFGNGGSVVTTVPVPLASGIFAGPATPAGLGVAASVENDRLHLSWQPTAGASSYEIWRNATNDFSAAARVAQNVHWSVWQDLTAAPNVVYYYWIKAVNPAGTSAASAPASGSYTTAAVAPAITTQPVARTVATGAGATFSVVATGSAPLSYQWQKGGTPIGGATAASYTIASTTLVDTGSYAVVVSNSAGSVTSNSASLTVLDPPAITTPPQSQTITAGNPVTFSVVATGSAPLAYQWSKGGTPISGATTSSYTIPGVAAGDAGNYAVTVSNAVGTITSSAATLTVNPAPVAPTITTPPLSQSVNTGMDVNFSVVASGTAPLTYQWRKGGSNLANGGSISGATTAALSVTSAQAGDAGSYDVVVTNPAGTATSSAATLTVTTAPATGQVTAGVEHTLYLRADGALFGMGRNSNGQLGDGTTTNRLTMVTIATGVQAMAGGWEHSLFVKTDGTLWATGGNGRGQQGDGTTTGRLTPAQVGTGVSRVGAGDYHSFVIKTDGTLWGMGADETGRLGLGVAATSRLSPVQIATGVTGVSTGVVHSLFVKSDGTAWGMGRNGNGQVGDGTTTQRLTPVQIGTNVRAVVAGGYHGFLLKNDNTLWGFGYNGEGEIGNGTSVNPPGPVQVATNVAQVAAGLSHSLFVKTDGTLWAMGDNTYGQLGTGDAAQRLTPVQVAINVAFVATGDDHTIFIKTDGSVWAMGANAAGQLGDGTTTNRLNPVRVQ